MGVVRFDGRNFREYNRSNSPALLSDRCSLIHQSKASGRILIEPRFGTHRYLTVTADYQLQVDSLLPTTPYQSHFRGNEVFYFPRLYQRWAGRDTGVIKGLFDRLELNRDQLTVSEKQEYVRKGQDYFYLDENTAEIRILTELTGHGLKTEFMVGDVYVCIDRQNRIFSYRQGLLQRLTGSDRLLKLLGQVDVNGPYPIQTALYALRDAHHSFLVHGTDILLLSINGGRLDLEPLASNTAIRDINCLIYDQQNKIIYIGTATSGLYILKKREFQPLYFSGPNYAINSLYAQAELPNGTILTSSGMLSRDGKINIPTPRIYDRAALLRSSDGYIWYSSYGWLKRVDTAFRHPENILSLGDISYFGIWITSIVEMPGKEIFCSTMDKIFRIRGKTATVLLDTKIPMKNAEIMVIQPVDVHHLWIGTSSGVYSLDLLHGTLIHLCGLEKTAVRSIYKARDGSIWVGTYGQGFYKYVRGGFLRMPMDQENNLATVHCFMEDKQGYFWLPTNKGLFRVFKRDLDSFADSGKDNVYYYYFDRSSGFRSNEFNGGCTPCGIITSDGHFSLPSLDGLVQFQPDSVTIMAPVHPMFIDRLAIDNKTMLAGDRFRRSQDAGPLVLSISSPYYGNPVNLHLDYSIPELDGNWHPVSYDGKLVLTGLHRGNYTLTVRKQEGYSRYTYKTLHWTILPYWYETLGFRLLAAVILISILPLILYFRYTRQVRRSQLLEQKVAERTSTLSESNRVKEKMIAIILHDLRSPLRFLHMLAVQIHESHKRITVLELDEMLRKFQNATRDLYEFAQDFVIWTNAQKEGFVIQQERVILRQVVDEIVSLYETGADIRDNTVVNLVPETISLVTDPHILKLVIRNLTDNANKYTTNGEIKIEAEENFSFISLTIADTGRSMDQQLIADILNNTYQSNDDSHGFGYKIILELLTRIHGRLSIETPDNGGNRVTLLFERNQC
jgi:signal transduction histidine kinase